MNNNKKQNYKKNKDLFFFHELSIGGVFFLHKGLEIKNKLIRILREIKNKNNCKEIETPPIMNGQLWQKTGHLTFFKENMFLFGDLNNPNKNTINGFKPMSCPGAALVFKHLSNQSYKCLPLKTCEFGRVFRNEPSGTLIGMKRLTNMTQDDGHTFLSEEHIYKEINQTVQTIIKLYNQMNLKFKIYLSVEPTKFIGELSVWNNCIKIFKEILNNNKLDYITSNSGAFYGPKIDFCIIDEKRHKEWQCGTIQLDFYLTKNLNAYYKDKNNKKKFPITLHYSYIGTLERFIGVLLDVKNKLPYQLSPYGILIDNQNIKNQLIIKQITKILSQNYISYDVQQNKTISKIEKIKYNFILKIFNNNKIMLFNTSTQSKAIINNIKEIITFLNILKT